jgi:hypothetical protein
VLRPGATRVPLAGKMSLLGTGLLLLTGMLGTIRNVRAFAQHAAAQQLRLHRCPSCNYPLDGIEPDERNLRTCPECSATWELPVPLPRLHD